MEVALSSTTVNSPPAAESIAGNEDLLTKVLSQLPVRPLVRFKSVSRQWLNVISDRHFSHLQSRRHRNPSCSALLFFHHSLSSPTSLPSCFEFIPLGADGNRSSRPPFFSDLESSNLKILQSCNGLMLLRSLIPKFDDVDFAYFVCNPTINQISRLPVPDEIAVGDVLVVGINLAFDPEKWEGYKIICIWESNSDENQHGIDVYLPETSQWRRAIDCHLHSLPFDLEFERGVYCDGKIHWLSHTGSSALFRCGGIFSRFMMTSSLSSSSDRLSVGEEQQVNRNGSAALQGRSKSWRWALASPMRTFLGGVEGAEP